MTKSTIYLWLAPLVLASTAAPALAEPLTYENGSGGSVTLYGQFSPSFVWADDGNETTSKGADNDSSNSRVGLRVMQPFAPGTLTFNFETALGFRYTDGISQIDDGDSWHWGRERLRKVDFAFATNSWGTFSLGQGSMATDGITESDFNKNGMTTYVSVTDTNGGFLFRTEDESLSAVSIGDAASSLDGGRRGRVRYDTPSYNGFTLSLAAGQEVLSYDNSDDYYDVALRYHGDFDRFKLSGGIGYSRRDRDDADDDKDTIGSLAVLHKASGVSLALAAGSRKDDGNYWYSKLGYDADIWAIGTTSLAIDYYKGQDFVSDGSDTKVYGIGANQHIDRYDLSLYAGYRKAKFDERTQDYKDLNTYILGAIWKF